VAVEYKIRQQLWYADLKTASIEMVEWLGEAKRGANIQFNDGRKELVVMARLHTTRRGAGRYLVGTLRKRLKSAQYQVERSTRHLSERQNAVDAALNLV